MPSTDLVGNIPVKAQNSPPAADDELDKIMQDVGQQLKNEDRQPSKKHRFFGRRPKSRPEPKLQAQPLPPAIAQKPPSASPASPPQAKPAAQPKPAATSSVPVLAITLTIIVTGVLIIAAVYAYKK